MFIMHILIINVLFLLRSSGQLCCKKLGLYGNITTQFLKLILSSLPTEQLQQFEAHSTTTFCGGDITIDDLMRHTKLDEVYLGDLKFEKVYER